MISYTIWRLISSRKSEKVFCCRRLPTCGVADGATDGTAIAPVGGAVGEAGGPTLLKAIVAAATYDYVSKHIEGSRMQAIWRF
jgi:hypothetical protein